MSKRCIAFCAYGKVEKEASRDGADIGCKAKSSLNPSRMNQNKQKECVVQFEIVVMWFLQNSWIDCREDRQAFHCIRVSQDFVENIFSVHYGRCKSLVSEPFSG
ncbi:hypothetical protein ABEV22_04505, partial [Geobacillus stearothermophilus]|uniref:hypothetical protein n=1 Tax=Geobacillus stearothermophilus TaxID=1422 RepID=UPI003D237256